MKNEFKEGLKVTEPNDQQKAQLYQRFKGQQGEQFELYINYINKILCILKHYRIVSDFTKFHARIKSTDSAVENDGLKALDDVFGMEVDYATPGESDFVSEIIKSTLHIGKQKIHDKDNGYQAYHVLGYPTSEKCLVNGLEVLLNKEINPDEEYKKYCNSRAGEPPKENSLAKKKLMKYFTNLKKNIELYSTAIKKRMNKDHMEQLKADLQHAEDGYLKEQKALARVTSEASIPVIEFQSKTIQIAIEANIGTASHEVYKGVETEKIQEEYDKVNGKIALSQVPTMYSSNLEIDENGKIKEPQILSTDDTLKVLYPGLITGGFNRNGDAR